jgi:hypothetical protein
MKAKGEVMGVVGSTKPNVMYAAKSHFFYE